MNRLGRRKGERIHSFLQFACIASLTVSAQDANSNLVFTNGAGMRSNGRFADATTVIATNREGGLRGALTNNGETIRWATGNI